MFAAPECKKYTPGPRLGFTAYSKQTGCWLKMSGLPRPVLRREMKFTETHMKRIIIAAIIASMAAPTWAMPVVTLKPSVSDTVTNVDLRRPPRHRPGHGVRPPHHRPPHHRPPHHRPPHHRPPHHHWHSRNNNGAIAAGVIGGMLLGGMAVSAARQHNHSAWNNHVNWCSQRYRSYRVSDNSWQPNNGPRRQCISPF